MHQQVKVYKGNDGLPCIMLSWLDVKRHLRCFQIILMLKTQSCLKSLFLLTHTAHFRCISDAKKMAVITGKGKLKYTKETQSTVNLSNHTFHTDCLQRSKDRATQPLIHNRIDALLPMLYTRPWQFWEKERKALLNLGIWKRLSGQLHALATLPQEESLWYVCG